jgi:F0F1-type ATP synthase assembly protein I
MIDTNKKNDNKRLLLKYAGFATELMAGLALAVLIGNWLDKKMHIHVPVFTWVLPLLVLIFTFIKVIRDTSKK